MKENWKVKVKDMKIKHMNNKGVNHNYLVLIDKLNSRLRNIKNCINSADDITWRSFYEIFKIENNKYRENKLIYNKLSEIEISTGIMLNNKKIQLNKIYGFVANLINN